MVSDELEKKLDALLLLVEETMVEKSRDKEYREQHAAEHRFLRKKMQEAEQSEKFWRDVAKKLASGGIWSLIVGVFAAIVYTIKAWFLGNI